MGYTFNVGVFDDPSHPRRKPTAYTTYYNPSWSDCCMHEVIAINGTEAKKIAIAEHIAVCRKKVRE